jgi:hypothetical protein
MSLWPLPKRRWSAGKGGSWMNARRTTGVPHLKVTYPSGRARKLPLWDSSRPRVRTAAVYIVKTLPDGIRLAYNRDYKLLGSVRVTEGEWEAALIHSLETWPGYSVNDRVEGDAVWFEVCAEAREPYRRAWIEKREWTEEESEDE